MTNEQEAELRYEAGMYKSLYDVAKTRIEALEAALRTIRLQNVEPYCREIARAALDNDAWRGTQNTS